MRVKRCCLKEFGLMAVCKKLRSLEMFGFEKVCLGDAFVYGIRVKSNFADFLAVFLSFLQGLC